MRKLSILPLFLPSVSVVAVFWAVFEPVESELPVYSIFLWKYIGMGVVILVAASVMITVLLAGFVALCRRNLYGKGGSE